MNKTVYRAIFLSLLLILMPIICLASAEQATTFYYDNGKEITVINENLSYEEKKMIADFLYPKINQKK